MVHEMSLVEHLTRTRRANRELSGQCPTMFMFIDLPQLGTPPVGVSGQIIWTFVLGCQSLSHSTTTW